MPDLPDPDCLDTRGLMPRVPDPAAGSSASSRFLMTPQGTMAAPSADFFAGIVVLGIALPALLQVFYAAPGCCS